MNTIISQAMATGLPVITTKHSGLPEQVFDKENGLVVAEGDYRALADCIEFLMEHDQLWPAYGRRARELALLNYDSRKLMEQQIGYYQQVLSEGRPRVER